MFPSHYLVGIKEGDGEVSRSLFRSGCRDKTVIEILLAMAVGGSRFLKASKWILLLDPLKALPSKNNLTLEHCNITFLIFDESILYATLNDSSKAFSYQELRMVSHLMVKVGQGANI